MVRKVEALLPRLEFVEETSAALKILIDGRDEPDESESDLALSNDEPGRVIES